MTQDRKSVVNLGPDASAELNRFQKGLEFINVVRNDIGDIQRQDTKACTADTIDANNGNLEDSTQSSPLTIDRFDVRTSIGEGGFANVYLAFDPVLNRDVALKVLRRDQNASPETTARFKKEARVAALLSHPNIVPVFDAGVCEGQPYIVSRYCRGESLSQWIERKKEIDIRLAARIIRTIAVAVEYAHQRGIVHRDLKPANVLVESAEPAASSSSNMPDRLRVTDFGLAKFSEDTDQMKTVDGVILGTPAFMSPEQAEGTSVSFASDIYSIGVMLYQLLTGKLPHLGETHLQTIFAITNDEPLAPSKWNRQIPRDLDAICLKCLSKEPKRRYASAFELAQDIGNYLAGEPVSATVVTVLERVFKWYKRNPVLSAAFATTVVALAFALIQLNRANSNYQRAQTENAKSRRNIQLAQDTVKEMVLKIAPSSSIPIDLRKELVVRAAELQERLLADDPDNRRIIYETADSYSALSVLHEQLRQFDESLEAIDKAIELVSRTPPLDSQVEQQTEHRARLQKSEILVMLNRNQEALQVLNLTNIKPKNAHQFAQRTKGEARILENQKKYEEAWLRANEAKVIYEAIPPDIFSKGGYADILYQIGIIEISMGRFDDAERSLLKSIDVFNDVGSRISYHETLACGAGLAHRNLAWARKQLGKTSAALESITESGEIFDVLLDHNNIRPVYLEHACRVHELKSDWLIENGSIDQAVPSLDRAQSIFEKIPLPKLSKGISAEKTESVNLKSKNFAVSLIELRSEVIEQTDDEEIQDAQFKRIEPLQLYLNMHFSDDVELIERLEIRLNQLKSRK